MKPSGQRLTPVALLCRKLGYSLSPVMHNAAFEALDWPCFYLPLAVGGADLPKALAAMRRLGFLGANVTWPHKEAVVPLLDGLAPEARRCGSVNTVTNRAGRLTGHSTDGEGFLRACRFLGVRLKGSGLLLLGTGGAGRAVAFAAAASGVEEITLVNRTLARAESLAADLAGLHPRLRIEAASLAGLDAARVKSARVVVNATTVGLASDGRLVGPGSFRRGQTLLDLVYAPPVTPLMAEAAAAGARARNGLAMLLFQAEASFRLWTGRRPPAGVMGASLASAVSLPKDFFSTRRR